jgi:alpha-amylase/alpha-mannosidase (GH57 family)
MERYICIHGHFYQPPRENAWLEYVEQQDSAYPYHDWNERITAECYAPNTMARILDGDGLIERLTSNYARISFNFGPTLLAWMADKDPVTYRAILQADKDSQKRFSGHGSAIAQSYNHTILPLCNARDKYTQILWGIRDFEFRFGRRPEGMWLPETAVDLETLEILSKIGIRFTILSPYQAKRVRKATAREWRDASGGKIDPSTPYEVRLQSGRRIAVFFYDGPISQAIAFEGLLARGEDFAMRLASGFSDRGRTWPQIVHIATDGETYGHHHQNGDMALAYALHHIEARKIARLTNYGEYLAKHPPTQQAEIWERTAWSCSHGVERWNSNCGCSSGGYPNWNQEWRMPLRHAFDWLRDSLAVDFEKKGKELLRDPWAARDEYIQIILDRSPENLGLFFDEYSHHPLSPEETTLCLKLLEMQRYAMLMYTSCGWFFDELSGIETTQVIQYAARAIQLHAEIFGTSYEAAFEQRLSFAKSNIAQHGDGQKIYETFVRPAMMDAAKVAAHYALRSIFEPYAETSIVYCYEIEREDLSVHEAGRTKVLAGRVRITARITRESEVYSFGALHMGGHSINAGVRVYRGEQSYNTLKKDLVEPFMRADFAGVLRLLDRHFGESIFSLRSIFRDDQRRIVNILLRSSVEETERTYWTMYEAQAPMMRFLADLRVPLPSAFSIAAEMALNSSLRKALEDVDNFDIDRIRALLQDATENRVPVDCATLGFAIGKTITVLSEQFGHSPFDLALMKKIEDAAAIARHHSFLVNFWRSQNVYFHVLHSTFRDAEKAAQRGDPGARDWLHAFRRLGQLLSVRVPCTPFDLPNRASET